MEKAHDKLKKYGTIIATVLATAGIFAVANKNRAETENAPKNPTELTTDIPNDVIDFDDSANDIIDFNAEATQTFQVDTITDANIIKQINEGNYDGSVGHYNFDTNTTTTHYFKGAEHQISAEDMVATQVHEGAHAKYANTYGQPLGKITPEQAYCLEFASEFYGYIHETVYQMNESAKADSIIGMHHNSNRQFGDMLDAGLLGNYQS